MNRIIITFIFITFSITVFSQDKIMTELIAATDKAISQYEENHESSIS